MNTSDTSAISAISQIHPTAVIDSSAIIGQGVVIGPYAIVGPKTRIGDGCQLAPHAVIEGYTMLGAGCKVSPGAVIGGLPQDLHFGGEESYVEIGENTIIRECVTINRATGEGNITRLGKDCMLMAYAHLAHNVQAGDNVILANNVQVAGHVEIGDYVFVGGSCAIHQFVRIGRMAIVGGFSGSRQDIPPFSMSEGRPQATIVGLNKIGLKRRGVSIEQRTHIKRAYQLLWFSDLNHPDAIARIQEDEALAADPLVQELVSFVQTSKRGIHRPDAGVRFDSPSSEGSSDILAPV